MKIDFKTKIEFDKYMKLIIFSVVYLLVFYLFIIKNIFSLYEVKDDIENATARYERLKFEKENFIEERKNLEEKIKNNNFSEENIKTGNYFYNIAQVIYFLDRMVVAYDAKILKINNIEKQANIVRIPIEVEMDEEYLMAFLSELEDKDYGFFLLDKNLVITVKKGSKISLSMKLAVALAEEPEDKNLLTKKVKDKKIEQPNKKDTEELTEDAEQLSKDEEAQDTEAIESESPKKTKKLFNLDSSNKSFMRIGSNVVYSTKSISKSEAKRLAEEREAEKKKKKTKKKKKKEIKPVEKDVNNESKVIKL